MDELVAPVPAFRTGAPRRHDQFDRALCKNLVKFARSHVRTQVTGGSLSGGSRHREKKYRKRHSQNSDSCAPPGMAAHA